MARIDLIAPNMVEANGANRAQRLAKTITEDRIEGEVPRKVTANIDEQVLAHIRSSPGGMGIDALSKLLEGEISRRSLQRRMSQLVAARKLISEKKGRSTRYLLPPSAGEVKREESSVALLPIRSRGKPESVDATG